MTICKQNAERVHELCSMSANPKVKNLKTIINEQNGKDILSSAYIPK